MDGGKIIEEGSFQNLISDDKEFAKLLRDFGAAEKEKEKSKKAEEETEAETQKKAGGVDPEDKEKTKLMQDEERERGAVAASVYKAYMRFAGGMAWAPFILVLLVLMECATGQSIHLHSYSSSSSISPV